MAVGSPDVSLPVAGAGIALAFHHLNLIDIFDGVRQLVGDFQVPGAQLTLAGQFIQLVAKHIAELIHCFLAHIYSPFRRSGPRPGWNWRS